MTGVATNYIEEDEESSDYYEDQFSISRRPSLFVDTNQDFVGNNNYEEYL
jgi:hypothetical protein